MVAHGKEHAAEGGAETGVTTSRRSLLRGITATGTVGALSGCLGTVEREYETTPGAMSAAVARQYNFSPEPEVEKRTTTVSKDLVVTTVEAEVTSYTYRYDYLGDTTTVGGLQSVDEAATTTDTETDPELTPTPRATDSGTEPSPTPVGAEATPTEAEATPTPTPTQTDAGTESSPTPEPTPTRTDAGTEPAQTATATPAGAGADDEETAPTRTPISTPVETTPTGTPAPSASGGATGGDESGDRLTISTTPNPKFIGQSLNPAAGKSLEELIRTETEAFEQACSCTIGNPERIDVRTTSTPTGVQFDRSDVGTTVVQWSGSDWPSEATDGELPATVEFLGEERTIGYFAFVTGLAEGEGIQATLLVTAKGTNQLGDGTPEAVVAAYTHRTRAAFDDPPLPLFATDGGGLFDPAVVVAAAERFAPVCPCVTGSEGGETGTPGLEPPGTSTPGGAAAGTATPQDLREQFTAFERLTGDEASSVVARAREKAAFGTVLNYLVQERGYPSAFSAEAYRVETTEGSGQFAYFESSNAAAGRVPARGAIGVALRDGREDRTVGFVIERNADGDVRSGFVTPTESGVETQGPVFASVDGAAGIGDVEGLPASPSRAGYADLEPSGADTAPRDIYTDVLSCCKDCFRWGCLALKVTKTTAFVAKCTTACSTSWSNPVSVSACAKCLVRAGAVTVGNLKSCCHKGQPGELPPDCLPPCNEGGGGGPGTPHPCETCRTQHDGTLQVLDSKKCVGDSGRITCCRTVLHVSSACDVQEITVRYYPCKFGCQGQLGGGTEAARRTTLCKQVYNEETIQVTGESAHIDLGYVAVQQGAGAVDYIEYDTAYGSKDEKRGQCLAENWRLTIPC